VFSKAALFVYLGIFSTIIASGLGFPIPEELPIVTAGAWVGHAAEPPPPDDAAAVASALASAGAGAFPVNAHSVAVLAAHEFTSHIPLRWWIMLPLCIVAVVIGDCFLYGLGRFWGPRLLETRWMKRVVSPEGRAKIENNFHRYGVLVLLFARFLPTIRAPIFITAGVMRVSFARFVLADGLYAIPGVSLLFGLAFWFGDQFRDLVKRQVERVESLRPILILLAIAAVVVYLVYHFLRHPVATGDPREELPVIGQKVAEKIEHGKADPPASDTPPSQPSSCESLDNHKQERDSAKESADQTPAADGKPA
jgi:membrane protein DedA with SNARE-associated domain